MEIDDAEEQDAESKEKREKKKNDFAKCPKRKAGVKNGDCDPLEFWGLSVGHGAVSEESVQMVITNSEIHPIVGLEIASGVFKMGYRVLKDLKFFGKSLILNEKV
ncbi:hypothetical protein CDAR_482371 [Caerostris darwini]|uniref:Uncharacterized protein n=1 Tax=Caerostris darwini TaxID=1538125 RepID=A0AAV4TN47_9ARAC|nr:hypothetical protein CDAR_482371 [Caerostris darwini]